VEAGRWNRRGDRFRSSGNAQYARARAHKVAQVTQALESVGEARSDQHWIWADIAAKSSRMSAGSDTAAMSNMFDVHRASVDEYLKAFPRVGGQVGAVFAIDETPVGLDLFEDEKIFGSLFPKLLRSYALDAVEAPVGQLRMRVNDQRRSAEIFMNKLAESAAKRPGSRAAMSWRRRWLWTKPSFTWRPSIWLRRGNGWPESCRFSERCRLPCAERHSVSRTPTVILAGRAMMMRLRF
jgi:hypothetical protein